MADTFALANDAACFRCVKFTDLSSSFTNVCATLYTINYFITILLKTDVETWQFSVPDRMKFLCRLCHMATNLAERAGTFTWCDGAVKATAATHVGRTNRAFLHRECWAMSSRCRHLGFCRKQRLENRLLMATRILTSNHVAADMAADFQYYYYRDKMDVTY